jgi:hypothetical protein
VPLTVRDRAATIATLRHIEITLMETLARWVPTTPLMEAKVLFGRHIWEVAQHADILGKRTYELRAPLNLTLAPTQEFASLLADVAAIAGQGERVAAFYEVLLPAVISRCRAYIETTDGLLDEPSVRIAKRIIAESEAMIAEAQQLRAAQPALASWDTAAIDSLASRERTITRYVAPWQAAGAAAAEVVHA